MGTYEIIHHVNFSNLVSLLKTAKVVGQGVKHARAVKVACSSAGVKLLSAKGIVVAGLTAGKIVVIDFVVNEVLALLGDAFRLEDFRLWDHVFQQSKAGTENNVFGNHLKRLGWFEVPGILILQTNEKDDSGVYYARLEFPITIRVECDRVHRGNGFTANILLDGRVLRTHRTQRYTWRENADHSFHLSPSWDRTTPTPFAGTFHDRLLQRQLGRGR